MNPAEKKRIVENVAERLFWEEWRARSGQSGGGVEDILKQAEERLYRQALVSREQVDEPLIAEVYARRDEKISLAALGDAMFMNGDMPISD